MYQERERGGHQVGEAQDLGATEPEQPSGNTRFTNIGAIPPVHNDAAGSMPSAPSASDRAYGGIVPPSGHEPKAQHVGESTSTSDETPNKRVDPKLVIDPRRVEFPATPVGASSTAEVTVRNPDEGAHTMDPAIPLTADPFQDFKVRQNSNVVLPPGEARTVKLDFTPSRHGAAEQAFQLGTDRGWGPLAEVHVAGAGTEVNSAKTEDEIATQEKGRLADQDFQREHIEASRSTDPNRAKRVAAEHAVAEWKSRAVEYNTAVADWTGANWERFLGKTGGDVQVSEPGRIAKFLKAKALKGFTTLVTAPLKEEEPTGFVRKQVEKGVEKAVDKFGEWLWDKMTGDKKPPSPEEAALEATEHVADQSIAKGRDISHSRDAANLVVADTESAARLRIESATNAVELETWGSWARSELHSIPKDLDPKDVSLSEELLSTWVQERASTPTTSNGATNSKAWDKAKDELKKSGKLPSIETTDLFLHQCRYEWNKIGMSSDDIEAAIAELQKQRFQIEADLRGADITDQKTKADVIAHRLGDTERAPIAATFRRSRDPESTAAAFANQQVELGPNGFDQTHFVRPNSFSLDCWLQLSATDKGGVFVKQFLYHDNKYDYFWRKP